MTIATNILKRTALKEEEYFIHVTPKPIKNNKS
jgi:hypothetical protein